MKTRNKIIIGFFIVAALFVIGVSRGGLRQSNGINLPSGRSGIVGAVQTSVPWIADTITAGFIHPVKINGTEQTVQGTSFTATSTTATSTFAGGLTVQTNKFLVQQSSGRVGIGTTSPDYTLNIDSPSSDSGNIISIDRNDVRIAQITAPSNNFSITSIAGTFGLGSQGNLNTLNITNGIVGIGTTSPSGALDVENSCTNTTIATFDNCTVAVVNTDKVTTNSMSSLALRHNDANGTRVTGGKMSAVFSDITAGTVDADIALSTVANSTLSEKARLTNTGSFGVGTSTPKSLLSVVGASAATYGLASIWGSSGTATNPVFTIWGDANPETLRVVVLRNGNTAIGTSVPLRRLEVATSTASATIGQGEVLRLSGDPDGNLLNTVSEIGFGQPANISSNPDVIIGAVKTNTTGFGYSDIFFATRSTNGNIVPIERARIAGSTGNFGIATTTPTSKLSVNGASYFAGSIYATSTMTLTGLTGATGGTNQDLCIVAATGVVVNETTGTCVVSSRRYKHDIDPLVIDALAKVLKLKPVVFTYNDDDVSDYKDRQYGLIAEDVADVDPHFAKYGTDGLPRTLDDRALLSTVIKAMQEQQAQIEVLKAEVKKLKDNK